MKGQVEENANSAAESYLPVAVWRYPSKCTVADQCGFNRAVIQDQ